MSFPSHVEIAVQPEKAQQYELSATDPVLLIPHVQCAWCGLYLSGPMKGKKAVLDPTISHGCCSSCSSILLFRHKIMRFYKKRLKSFKKILQFFRK